MVALAQPTQTFDQLWQTYQPALRKFVLKRTGNADDADDVVQDVFLSAWRVRNTLRAETIRAWFYACATNRVRDRLRKVKRGAVAMSLDNFLEEYHGGSAGIHDYESAPRLPDSLILDDDSDQGALDDEAATLIYDVLARLGTREAAALTFRDLVGMEPQACASALGVSMSVFKKAAWQARGHFRREARAIGADSYWADRYDVARTGMVDAVTASKPSSASPLQ